MIPLSFKSYFFSVIEEAVFKTASEYYNEKFGQLEKLLSIPEDSDEDTFSKLKDLTVRARNVLKNDNQMEYYLYWIKFELLQDMAELYTADLERSKVENFTVNEKLVETIKQLYKKHFDNGKKRGLNPMNIPTDFRDKYRFLTNVEHYLSLNIPTINSYNFLSGMPSFGMLDHHLKKLEEEYYAKFDGLLTPSDLGDEEEVIINFTLDGKNFVWVNTHTDVTCDKEAKLMKHCGNSYHAGRGNDEVFSLREIKTVDKQVGYQPILTFIVDDHTLRESKGSANDKPSPKYHKHIVEILKTGEIRRIFQKDSYMAKNNFYFADLSDEQQQEVKDALDAKGVEYELDDESMDYTKDIAESKRLIEVANRKLKILEIDIDTEGEQYINYRAYGDFTFPLLTEEFWNTYGDMIEKKINKEAVSIEEMELEENANGIGWYVRFYINDSNEYFNTEEGRGSQGESLIDATDAAIRDFQYDDKTIMDTIEAVLGEIFDGILNKDEDFEFIPEFKTITNIYEAFNVSGLESKGFIYTSTPAISYENNADIGVDLSIRVSDKSVLTTRSFNLDAKERLETELKKHIEDLVLRHDEGSLYGDVDLLGEPIPPSSELSKIKDVKVVVVLGHRSVLGIKINMNYDSYMLLNKYTGFSDWKKIRNGVMEFYEDHSTIKHY